MPRSSIKLSTYEELFSSEGGAHTPKHESASAGKDKEKRSVGFKSGGGDVKAAHASSPTSLSSSPKGGSGRALTIRKLKTFTNKNLDKKNGLELMQVLQKQRVMVDENAIHFVSEARAGPRADARNSVFKIAQRYQLLPDGEHVKSLKNRYGNCGENEDSGDEAWDKKYTVLPGKLSGKEFTNMVDGKPTDDLLLDEIDKMEDEAQGAAGTVLSQTEVNHAECLRKLTTCIQQQQLELFKHISIVEERPDSEDSENPATPEEELQFDEEELLFDQEDYETLNSMQKEFIGSNLMNWFKDIQQAYETGVKLVKVNALGGKFIRIVRIKDMMLGINQPHTKSQVRVDRQVAITEIISVKLGRESKEFITLGNLVKTGKEPKEFDPSPTCCAVVELPKGRSLSLIFLQEDNRNGFVFFMRVIMKKANSVAESLAAK